MKQHFSGPQWNPAVKDLLNEIKSLSDSADSRARLITSPFYAHETDEERTLRQAKAAEARDAYDYCILRLMDLNWKI